MTNTSKNTKYDNVDRAQLQSLGEHFRSIKEGKNPQKQNLVQPLSDETQKGLRELAAREANI